MPDPIPAFAPRAAFDRPRRVVDLWCACGCGVRSRVDLRTAPFVKGKLEFEACGVYPAMRAAHASYYDRTQPAKELPPCPTSPSATN